MEERIAEASMVECNHGGIEVANVTNESLWWRRNWGDDAITEWKEAEIHHSDVDNDGDSFKDLETDDDQSEPYFLIGNVDEDGKEWMYFLNQFMRYDR